MGWQKKGVGHEVFLTEKGGHLKILVQKGGVQLFIIVVRIILEKNLTCINYCYHRVRARQQV